MSWEDGFKGQRIKFPFCDDTMMTAWQQMFWGWLAMAVVMLLLWIIERIRKDASLVDVGWAFGMGGLALWFGVVGNGSQSQRLLVATLGAVWAFRLGLYLFFHRVWGKDEDGRYQTMRQSMGAYAGAGFFLFFQLQAIFNVIFVLPFLAVAQIEGGLTIWSWVGVVIWLVAVVGESVADQQLSAFRNDSNNKGKVCTHGLWRYSRHPNYFFEWLHWWCYVALAVGSSWWPLTLAGPAMMFVFLFFITGIPHTERQSLQSRGEAYRRYQKTTSIFIPWPPKKLEST